MRILLTMNLPWVPARGGANRSNRSFLETLVQRGHQAAAVVAALPTPSAMSLEEWRAMAGPVVEGLRLGSDADTFSLAGVEVVAVHDPAFMGERLKRTIERFAPDAVIVSTEDASMRLLSAALAASPERVIYQVRTPSFLPFGPCSFFPSPARAQVVRGVRSIVTTSRATAEYIEKWGGVRATALGFSDFDLPARNVARSEPGRVTLINACDVKGLPLFLEIAAAMPDVAFGAVPSWGTTPDDLARLRTLPNVEVVPPRDDIDDLFAGISILMVPSLWHEAFGRVIVEAKLRGVPVVASDSGGIPEAMLGTGITIATSLIEAFEDELDANVIPRARLPVLDPLPWIAAIRELLDPARYRAEAAAGLRAGAEFVRSLSVQPFVEHLEHFCGNRARATTSSSAAALPAAVADKLAALTPEQRSLLIQRARKARSHPAGVRASIPRADRTHGVPASLEQERIWAGPPSVGSAHNVAFGLRLSGRLNEDAFARAWSELVRRHEPLRTTFERVEGVLLQRVDPASASALARPDRHEEWVALLEKPLGPPEPLVRAALHRVGATEHLFGFAAHAVLMDAVSARVLCGDLGILYGAQCGAAAAPSDLVLQYADVAAWERSTLGNGALARDRAYWERELASARGIASQRPSHRCGRTTFALDPELSTGVRNLARNERVSPFMVFLTAVMRQLCRSPGQSDAIIGTYVTNRARSEMDGMVGPLGSVLPIRVAIEDATPFRETLQAVKEKCLGAQEHASFPLGAARPYRIGCSVAPAFSPSWTAAGVEATWVPANMPDALEELSFHIDDLGAHHAITAVHSRELFSPARVDEICGDLVALLQQQTAAHLKVGVRPAGRVAPRNDTEARVAALWQEVLGTATVGISDNFFDIGGHSLLAVRLFRRIEEAFGWRLPLRVIFEAATVEEMARFLQRGQNGT